MKRKMKTRNRKKQKSGITKSYSAIEDWRIIILTIASGCAKGKLGFTFKTNDEKFFFNAQAIATAIRLNKLGFYTPQFDKLGILENSIDFFGKSIERISQGGLGKVGAKNTAKRKVKNGLDSALEYINNKARLDIENGVTIITGAKLIVHKKRVVNKKELEAKYGNGTGVVILSCIAEKINGKYVDTTYMWQFSIDNGKTWEPIDPTNEAKVIVEGMLPKIATLFRKRSKTKKGGMSAWCPPILFYPN